MKPVSPPDARQHLNLPSETQTHKPTNNKQEVFIYLSIIIQSKIVKPKCLAKHIVLNSAEQRHFIKPWQMNNCSSRSINVFCNTEALAVVHKQSQQGTPRHLSAETTERVECWGSGTSRELVGTYHWDSLHQWLLWLQEGLDGTAYTLYGQEKGTGKGEFTQKQYHESVAFCGS